MERNRIFLERSGKGVHSKNNGAYTCLSLSSNFLFPCINPVSKQTFYSYRLLKNSFDLLIVNVTMVKI